MDKQKFDGSWKIDEDLCRILGKPLDKIKKATVVKVCVYVKNAFCLTLTLNLIDINVFIPN